MYEMKANCVCYHFFRLLREQWIRAKYERNEFEFIEKQEPYSAGGFYYALISFTVSPTLTRHPPSRSCPKTVLRYILLLCAIEPRSHLESGPCVLELVPHIVLVQQIYYSANSNKLHQITHTHARTHARTHTHTHTHTHTGISSLNMLDIFHQDQYIFFLGN